MAFESKAMDVEMKKMVGSGQSTGCSPLTLQWLCMWLVSQYVSMVCGRLAPAIKQFAFDELIKFQNIVFNEHCSFEQFQG